MTIDEYKAVIRERLGDKRYIHSLNVAKEAVRYAKKYGGDVEKAEIAGILHDCCKEITPDEQLEIMSSANFKLDDVQLHAQKLWHSIAGAIYVNKTLGITDEDIINAIRYHTTGRKNMSLLEKIVFLADFTSEERDYGDVDVIREKGNISLDEGILYGLQYTIKKLAKHERPLSIDSVEAYNEIALKG